MTDTPWMDKAKKYIGLTEVPGPKSNPIIEKFYKEVAGVTAKDDVPWCAAFVGHCLQEAGLKSTGALNAKSYVKYGTRLDKPVYGCIVVFNRAHGAAWQGHVAFCVGVDAHHIQVLGGNQGDRVSIESYPLNLITDNGLRWPGSAAPANAAPPKAVKAKAGKKVS